MTSGAARVYWIGTPPEAAVAKQLADRLEGYETLLHIVVAAPTDVAHERPSWIVDRNGEIGRAFGVTGPLAVVVDAGARIAAVLSEPVPDRVMAIAARLYRSSTPAVVTANAPVLQLERVFDRALCRTLIDQWHHGNKLANEVGSLNGNVANADVKRRVDVELDDRALFMPVRDCLVRRVTPAILQAFHTSIKVIEAPRIGCYEAQSGGWFRRHRDNTSSYTAHRQFAVSVNLNDEDDYEGGALRFPEFGRNLYRPAEGAALVFSSSLLHEVVPVTRGRRFGLFTFLSTSGPAASSGPSPIRSLPQPVGRTQGRPWAAR